MFEQDEAPFVGLGQEAGAEALDAFFAHTPRLAVAFSGGCDSSFLLAAALRAGCDVKAYGVRTRAGAILRIWWQRRAMPAWTCGPTSCARRSSCPAR